MRRRIIMVIVMTGAIVYVPWWFSALLALGAMWRFDSRYELLLPAAVADLAYGRPISQFFDLVFTATFFIALTVALKQILAKRFFLNP